MGYKLNHGYRRRVGEGRKRGFKLNRILKEEKVRVGRKRGYKLNRRYRRRVEEGRKMECILNRI